MNSLEKNLGMNKVETPKEEIISDAQFELAKIISEVVKNVSVEDKEPITRKWGELETLIRDAKANIEKGE